MSIKTILLCAAMGVSAVAMPVISQARINVDIDIAPPAPREELVPAPRAGYEWAPGYWNWSHNKHVWVGGHWNRARHGQHWVPEHWDQRGSKYHFEQGHWDHDHR